MEYSVWVDRNRSTYLQYREVGKTRHYVTMASGRIECEVLGYTEWKALKPIKNNTPENLACIYLNSFIPISSSARAILRGVLGNPEEPLENPRATSFRGGTVGIAEICEGLGIATNVARKHLRRLIDKPGGRWEWPPEEAEKISGMLKELTHGS